NKASVLGKIANEKFVDTELSKIVRECWYDLPNHYRNCRIDEFIIMPDHVHGIIMLINNYTIKKETGYKPVSTKYDRNHSLSEIIRAFKTFSAKRINALQKTIGQPFWQKDYFERIIRNENELNRIREYIFYNPLKYQWEREDIIKLFQQK
ncbi:MAG: transposase, partial [Ignavibacteria bacterium]